MVGSGGCRNLLKGYMLRQFLKNRGDKMSKRRFSKFRVVAFSIIGLSMYLFNKLLKGVKDEKNN